MERKSLIDECNPNGKIQDKVFYDSICSQCANPRCDRSRYSDSATQKKLQRREKLQSYIDPTTVSISDLSEYPSEFKVVTHKAEPPTKIENSSKLDESIKELGILRPSEKNEVSKVSISESKVETLKLDPWAAPSRESLHKEYSNIEEDPWSSNYSGGLNLKVASKAIIRMPKK